VTTVHQQQMSLRGNPDRRAIADRIVAARKAVGFTQYDAARLLGMSQGTYSHYETAYAQPSLNTFLNICRVLSTTPNFILGFVDHGPTETHFSVPAGAEAVQR
jgi:transcriptional regulator with XRE-family HTH domain